MRKRNYFTNLLVNANTFPKSVFLSYWQEFAKSRDNYRLYKNIKEAFLLTSLLLFKYNNMSQHIFYRCSFFIPSKNTIETLICIDKEKSAWDWLINFNFKSFNNVWIFTTDLFYTILFLLHCKKLVILPVLKAYLVLKFLIFLGTSFNWLVYNSWLEITWWRYLVDVLWRNSILLVSDRTTIFHFSNHMLFNRMWSSQKNRSRKLGTSCKLTEPIPISSFRIKVSLKLLISEVSIAWIRLDF